MRVERTAESLAKLPDGRRLAYDGDSITRLQANAPARNYDGFVPVHEGDQHVSMPLAASITITAESTAVSVRCRCAFWPQLGQ